VQLLSLASAFLSKTAKLVLLDEPTSQIDGATQKRVLKNLFQHCKDSTVLMIAHRLETAVAHTDKILVLDQGQLAEFDHPFKLLANSIEDVEITRRDTIFSQMVLALNEAQQQRVFEKAKKKYLK
jgi:ATP-binding cassette, subfamily C (CFTR/MRP), member 4